MPLNALTLDDLRKLNDQMTALVVAGFRLEHYGLEPRFDLSPGRPITIHTSAVMPSIDEGVTVTPLAADIVRRTSTREPTHCGPNLSAQLRKEAVTYAAILFPESTEAAPPAVGVEPVDPPSVAP